MKKLSPWALLALLTILFSTAGLNAQIRGSVFRDYNGNGTRDASEAFMPGVTVNAYNVAGTLCGSAVTVGGTTGPNYTLSGCGIGPVRVEFVLPTGGTFVDAEIDFPGLGGLNHGTSVQFVTGNSSGVNFAVADPDDYNLGAGSNEEDFFIPCYIAGNPLVPGTTANTDWFVGRNYPPGTPARTRYANGDPLGATWGTAYSKQADRVFAAALVKRHVGLGSLGSGGIYMLEPTASSFNVTEFYDMDANGHRTRAAAGAVPYGQGSSYDLPTNASVTYRGPIDPVSGAPEGLGVVGSNLQRGLNPDPFFATYDPASFDQVGKVGLGGLEISDDGRFLFVMNLYSRSVFRLELDDPANPTAVVNVTEISLPAVSCTNGVFRPWALTYHRGKLYAGGVCSEENRVVGGTLITDGAASIFEVDNPGTATAFATTPLFTFSLDYSRGSADDGWYKWTNENLAQDRTYARFPMPVLSDLTFANNGQMIISFLDRFGLQQESNNYRYLAEFTSLLPILAKGDLIVAGLDATTGNYTLETFSDPSTFTSNGVSFAGSFLQFFNDRLGFSQASTGTNAYQPGQPNIIGTFFDAFQQRVDNSALSNGFYGPAYFITGAGVPGSEIKGLGLGELSLSGPEAPLEIGNRVWLDTDEDGVQDPAEAGIPGVEVQLWKESTPGDFTQIATVITGASGEYYFTSAPGTSAPGITYGVDMLLPSMNYELRFPTSTPDGASTLRITSVNMGGTDPNADARDSDADIATGVVPFMTGGAGSNDHSFDVGFRVSVVNLEMEKTFVSAVSNGDGTFTVDYNITVQETDGGATTYDLSDTPGFDDDITINNGMFSGQNTGVLTAGANNLATNQPIAANATHTYNLSFNVTLDLTDGVGDNTYTPCDGITPTAGEGLYNLATITTAGMTGEDDACGDLALITHTKVLASVSTINGDGSYDVSYTITVSHLGGIAGQYDLGDTPNFDDDFTINNANYTSSAPPGLSGALSSIMGAANVLADDVSIAMGEIHTYTLNFNVSLDLTDGTVGDDLFTTCGATTGTPQAGEGLFNQSFLDLNNDGIPDEVEEVCTFEVCPPTGNCANINVQND